MTRGFLTTMKPNPCRVVLHVSIFTGLLLTLSADGEDLKCETQLKVRRNTIYEAFVGEDLRINCIVAFCNSSPPTVSWMKLEKTFVPVNVSSSSHIKTNWKTSTQTEGISLLIFTNILSSDSGSYQCHSGGSVSHRINVSVHDTRETTTATWNNDTIVTTPVPEPIKRLWMYVYSAAGIVVFVIIVIIISVISMRGCKGKSKQEAQSDNQYMEIPMLEQSSSRVSPRESPSAPPACRSTRRKQQDEQPSELTLPSDGQHVYGKIREDRQRQRDVVEEEGSSVVYAALNHQVPPRAAAWPLRPQEEYSEYAAIRVS